MRCDTIHTAAGEVGIAGIRHKAQGKFCFVDDVDVDVAADVAVIVADARVTYAEMRQ